MTSANRTRVALVRETTPGTTPDTPRMRAMRITGESLSFKPIYVDPDELRDDRMMDDPIQVMKESSGGINFELSFPQDETPLSELYRSAFFNPWVNTPQRDNDGSADSAITDVAAATGVVTVEAGDAFVARHLARNTGFTNAENNGLFRCTTGSATVPAFAGQGLVDEAAPPAAARVKVVGFEAAEADIAAVSDGITSTLLDFETLGLVVGQWIKIGGTGAAFRFATEACNVFARITVIAATKLTLDNLPAGWTTDDGTYATLRVFFGDQIKNGVTKTALTIEKSFLGQTVPTHIVKRGMHVNTLEHTITSRDKVKGVANFTGMGGQQSTVALDDSYEAVTTNAVMAANANVGRIAEAGARLTAPNWARELSFTINNNQRAIEAADVDSPVGVEPGECLVSGSINTYFGSNALLQKFFDGTPTAINSRIAKNNQAVIWQFPRVTHREGDPHATGKNTDVMLPLAWQSSKDTLTEAHVILDRFEYYQA